MYVIFPYIYHKNQRNVGKYTIHGSYGYGLSRCESKTEDFGPKGSRASSGQEPGSTSSVGKRFVKKWFPGRATLKDTNTWFVVLFFDIGKKNDIYIYILYIYIFTSCLMSDEVLLAYETFFVSSCCSTLGFLWKIFLSGPANGNFNWEKPGWICGEEQLALYISQCSQWGWSIYL